MQELYDYFKELNFCDENETEILIDENPDIELDVANQILNSYITASEIEEVVKNLPNEKGSGIDCIRN